MAFIIICSDVLDTRQIESSVSTHANGAVCTFVGQIRNHSRGKDVEYIEYQAHVALAEKELNRLAVEAETRWPVTVAISHRLGRVNVGEASVVVSVGSPHRSEAFAACQYCIDTLKVTVPIWKREVGPDGAIWIEGDESVRAGTD